MRVTTRTANEQSAVHPVVASSSSNVVGVHDVGVHDGWLWMSMEFVDGVTLSSWLKQRERGWRR